MGYNTTDVTVSRELLLGYTCSRCGTQNAQRQTISVTVDKSLVEHAYYELDTKLIHLQSVDPALRYRNAGFSCKCSHCGHCEPWTWFRQDLIQKAYILWGALFLLSFAFFAKTEITSIAVCGWIFRFFIIAAMAGTYYISANFTDLLRPEIEKLPKSALPKIFLENGEQLVPADSLPPNHWLCMECGFMNPNHFQACPSCNATKQWSLSKKQ